MRSFLLAIANIAASVAACAYLQPSHQDTIQCRTINCSRIVANYIAVSRGDSSASVVIESSDLGAGVTARDPRGAEVGMWAGPHGGMFTHIDERDDLVGMP